MGSYVKRLPFRRLSFLVALLAALAFAAPAHALDRAGLATTLARLHAKLGPAAGAYVVDEATGEVLYAHRANLALAPASNEKLFVSAAALLRFGPQGTLTTTPRAAPDATIEED